jgi:hypothetical protein
MGHQVSRAGKVVMECVIETNASTILQFIHGLGGDVHLTFEEGTWAGWLYDVLKPHVTELEVCNPRKNALLKEGSKRDHVDRLEEGGTFRRQLFETTSSLSVSGKESVPPGELFLAVAVGFLRRSDSRGSIHGKSQARASNTRVSDSTSQF